MASPSSRRTGSVVADRASAAGAAVLCVIGLERLVNAALLSSREVDFVLRLGFGILATVLGGALVVRTTHPRDSR